MLVTTVLSHGRLALGPEAEAAGFVEGALVQVVVLSSGSVLVTLDDEPAVDLPRRGWDAVPALRRAFVRPEIR